MKLRAMAVSLLVGGLVASGAQVAQADPGVTESSYSISGQVRDQTTGKPVSGIAVTAGHLSEVDGLDHTDARGRYRIELPQANTYSMDFFDPKKRYIGIGSLPVQIAGHERYDRRLARGGRIKARVLGNAGPLEDVMLDLFHRNGKGGWVRKVLPYYASTDAAGRISLPLLTPGTFRVRIDPHLAAGNNAPMFWGGTSTIKGSLRVKVRSGVTTRLPAARLRTGSTIYGTLTRPDGTPVQNAQVAALDLTDPIPNPTWPRSRRFGVGTDSDGKFTMDSLAAHPYQVCAVDNLVTGCLGGGADPVDSTTVRLSRGERREVRIVIPWP